MDKYTINFNIGFIAPSRAGKTSLLYALFYQLQNKLAHKDGYAFKALGETHNKMKQALAEYTANFDVAKKNEQGLFEGKEIKPSQESVQYEFQLYKKAADAEMEITLKFNDYPGGLVSGDGDFTVKATADLQESFKACDIMLVPIPADAVSAVIMNSGNADNRALRNVVNARLALDTDSVVQSLAKWINCREYIGAIRFVAVKCEHVFHSHQGGIEEVSAQNIYDYIKRNYYDRVLQLIPENKKDNLKGLHIEYYAVDTYGVVVYAGINHVNEDAFSANFKLMKNCPENLQPFGCVNVLVSALQFYLAKHKINFKDLLAKLNLKKETLDLTMCLNILNPIFWGISFYYRKKIKDCCNRISLIRQTRSDMRDLSDDFRDIKNRYNTLQTPDWLEPDEEFDDWLERKAR